MRYTDDMCGRYQFYDQRNEEVRRMIETVKQQMPEPEFRKLSLSEVFPGQMVLTEVFGHSDGKFHVCPMIWGYPGKGKLIINGRSETADVSRFFAGSSRCIIPASGYYEWTENPRQKYYIVRTEGMAYLGALCRREADGWRFVILTEAAQGFQKEIHDRMPLMFSKEDAKNWLKGIDYKRMLSASLKDRKAVKV